MSSEPLFGELGLVGGAALFWFLSCVIGPVNTILFPWRFFNNAGAQEICRKFCRYSRSGKSVFAAVEIVKVSRRRRRGRYLISKRTNCGCLMVTNRTLYLLGITNLFRPDCQTSNNSALLIQSGNNSGPGHSE